jgi:hypothetical protein
MFASPIAITIGAQAYSLKLKNQDNFGSTYMDNTTIAGTEVRLTFTHKNEGKAKVVASGTGMVSSQYERHIADLLVTVTDANGFRKTTQSYTHIRNRVGDAVTGVGDVAQALAVWLNTNAESVVAWES